MVFISFPSSPAKTSTLLIFSQASHPPDAAQGWRSTVGGLLLLRGTYICVRACVTVCEHLVGEEEGMRVHLSVLCAQPRKGLRARKPIIRMVTPV